MRNEPSRAWRSGWGWQMYGDQGAGMFAILPGRDKSKEQCAGSYDPRLRPWYSSAASGPKDVVVVIDTSGSMSNKGRMDKAKDAAKAVIKTLNWADYASIVSFGQWAEQMPAGNGKLLKADEDGRRKLDDYVDSLMPTGHA